MSFIDPSVIKPFKVVLDAGSGMAGLVAPKIFDRLPCQVTTLCFTIDGTFPNHEANPLLEENRADITAEVIRAEGRHRHRLGRRRRPLLLHRRQRRVHLGRLRHGAAGRGVPAEGAQGATIIYDLRASHAVKDTTARYGGRALMNKVGHAFIKQRMRQEDGVFAGEVTGHYYFKDFYYADNGFIPALLVLELMSKKNLSLRDLLAPFRERYFISGEINTKLASMDDVPREARRHRGALPGRRDRAASTACRWTTPTWHFNVRASNTEPLLRLNLEAETPAMMEQKRDEVLGIIRGR